MTSEQWVREKLGFGIEFWNNEQVCSEVVPLGKKPFEYRHVTSCDGIAAYNLCISLRSEVERLEKKVEELTEQLGEVCDDMMSVMEVRKNGRGEYVHAVWCKCSCPIGREMKTAERSLAALQEVAEKMKEALTEVRDDQVEQGIDDGFAWNRCNAALNTYEQYRATNLKG